MGRRVGMVPVSEKTLQERLRVVADRIERLLPEEAASCREAAGFLDRIAAGAFEASEGARHSGAGPTEVHAALVAAPRTGTQRERILLEVLRVVRRRPWVVGLTHEEVGKIEGVNVTAHRTRVRELVLGGWLEDSKTTRVSDTNTPSIVWAPTDKATALH